ncbi:MAG: vWA domain-containing protein [Planctomycetota bacterium]
MPETSDADSREPPSADAAGASGCVVFLVDESAAMDARVAGGTKSKAQSIATALNSLLNQLTAGPPLDVALVGYGADAQGEADIGPRWGGALAGREFVSTSELAGAPLSVENRVRKVPGSAPLGSAREETVRFPVWYVPRLGGTGARAATFEHCRAMLSAWLSAAGTNPKPPMLVSFVGELSDEDTPEAVGAAIHGLTTPGAPPLLLHAHLGSSDRVPATLYPSNDAHLPPGPIATLFQASSVLPPEFSAALGEQQVTVNADARGLIYHAKMVDLIRFLSLVKTYARFQPAVEAAAGTTAPATDATVTGVLTTPAPTAERVLLVLLLDRSVEDPTAEKEKCAWRRLEAHANDLLGQIAKRAQGAIDVAVVSHGTDAGGRTEVETTFAGPLAGRTVVGDAELAGRAIRVENFTKQVSNGIGGLVSISRRKPIFVDLKPTPAAAPAPAFAAVRNVLGQWREDHAGSHIGAVVVHLTRGCFAAEEIEEAVAPLREIVQAALYHWVLTESPHASVAYPSDPTLIQRPELVKLWELTSPLLGAKTLAAQKPTVCEQSRGMVINGKFDLLLEGIEEAAGT